MWRSIHALLGLVLFSASTANPGTGSCRTRFDEIERQIGASLICRYEYECRQIAIARLEKLRLRCDGALSEVDAAIRSQKLVLRELARIHREEGMERMKRGFVPRSECESTRQILSRATRVDPFDEKTSFLWDLARFDCVGSPLSKLLDSETASEQWRKRHVRALKYGLPPIDLPLMTRVSMRHEPREIEK